MSGLSRNIRSESHSTAGSCSCCYNDNELTSWMNYCFNSLRSVPDFLILLWLTPDDFTHQGETSREGKGSSPMHAETALTNHGEFAFLQPNNKSTWKIFTHDNMPKLWNWPFGLNREMKIENLHKLLYIL